MANQTDLLTRLDQGQTYVEGEGAIFRYQEGGKRGGRNQIKSFALWEFAEVFGPN